MCYILQCCDGYDGLDENGDIIMYDGDYEDGEFLKVMREFDKLKPVVEVVEDA